MSLIETAEMMPVLIKTIISLGSLVLSGEDIAGPDHSFGEDMKGLQDDSLPLDKSLEQDQLETLIQKVAHQQMVAPEPDFRMEGHYLPDNVEISRNAVHTG